MFWFSLFFVSLLALIHYSAKYLTFWTEFPQRKYLSFAGGIAVAYVFLHLLPEIETPEGLHELHEGTLSFLTHPSYFVALIGLLIFYGLDEKIKRRRKAGLFWVHIGSFFLYNALIGYLLVREEFHHVWGMALYFFAMAVHFITIDHNLRREHKSVYDHYGRWLLSVAIILGWGIGVLTEISELLLHLLTAFLAGGIILNVFKEELPGEKNSSIMAFSLGLVAYSILLLFIG